MKQLDRYVGGNVAAAMVLALFVLVMLDALFAFVAEIPNIGRAGYGSLQALTFVALTLPRRAYELFPTAALLGAVLGLGALAVSSELVAFRAAGISRQRIGAATLGACLVLLVPMMLLGEFVAPVSERAAQDLRLTRQARDLSVGGTTGFWARQGNAVINAERLLESGALASVTVYQFGVDHALHAVTRANLAQPVEEGWRLTGVVRTELSAGKAETTYQDSSFWPRLVDPGVLRVAAIEPENLSLRDLARFVSYLRANDLYAYRYQQAFWAKVLYPLSALALVCIGLPFVFGPLRQGGFGQRLFVGLVIGLLYFLFSRTLARLGDVYQLDPLAVTLVPPLLLLVVAFAYLRRTFA